MEIRALFLAGITLAMPASSDACTVLTLDPDARGTIAEAEWIAVARAAQIIQTELYDGRRYTLSVEDCLKGDCPNPLVVEYVEAVHSHSNYRSESNAWGHSASRFWAVQSTYQQTGSDCGGIRPQFGPRGTRYLIMGPERYSLGFENISESDDLWLGYVQAEIAGADRQPFPMDAQEYIDMVDAVVRISARWNGERTVFDTHVFKGPNANYVAHLFAQNGGDATTLIRSFCWPGLSYQPDRDEFDLLVIFEHVFPASEYQETVSRCTGYEDLLPESRLGGRSLYSAARTFLIEDERVDLTFENAVFDRNAFRNRDVVALEPMPSPFLPIGGEDMRAVSLETITDLLDPQP
jgi:hypothetical protein